MTQEELDELRRLASKATPGPWTFKPCEVESDPIGGDFVSSAAFLNEPYKVDCGDYLGLNDADAAYIAAANPSVLLRLLAQVQEAEARWEALKAWLPTRRNSPNVTTIGMIEAEMARLEHEQ